MTTQEIVSKLWNLCNVLMDDGITYHQYVTELTYILFLKMAKEQNQEKRFSEGIHLVEGDNLTPEQQTHNAEKRIILAYSWDSMVKKSGIELYKYYKELLRIFGKHCTGRVREIYLGSSTNIDEPKNLEKIITTIDGLDWYSAREEGLGNLYEGLLEKNANEKKSGAGQYFTPRVLIDVMTMLVNPQPGERCNDPACGTFGFMIAAHRHVMEATDDFFDLSAEQAEFERNEAFTGCELVHDTHRLALMNAMLHDINGAHRGKGAAQHQNGLQIHLAGFIQGHAFASLSVQGNGHNGIRSARLDKLSQISGHLFSEKICILLPFSIFQAIDGRGCATVLVKSPTSDIFVFSLTAIPAKFSFHQHFLAAFHAPGWCQWL